MSDSSYLNESLVLDDGQSKQFQMQALKPHFKELFDLVGCFAVIWSVQTDPAYFFWLYCQAT